MAARAIWKGIIRFGKFSLPVKLYSAVQDRNIHFHMLRAQSADQAQVRQRMVDPETEEAIESSEIQKGYEIEPGRFVIMTKEELEKLEPAESRDIEVSRFVPSVQVVLAWLERPYYLGPDGSEIRDYFSLAEALREEDKLGICHWVMRKKEYVGALSSHDGYLVLHSLRHADEVVLAADLDPPEGRKLDPKELDMAHQLMKALEGKFDPADYRDEYRARVEDLVAKKSKGKKLRLVHPPKDEPAPKDESLMKVLEASLGKIKRA